MLITQKQQVISWHARCSIQIETQLNIKSPSKKRKYEFGKGAAIHRMGRLFHCPAQITDAHG
jgi:hypothetical protein